MNTNEYLDHVRRGIAPFVAERANILHFFKTPKTMSQWQDWLWKRMPKLKAVTHKPPPHALRLGYWGSPHATNFDLSVRYTDLLMHMLNIGEVNRLVDPVTKTVTFCVPPAPAPVPPTPLEGGLDKLRPMPYVEEDPF